mmetsp:Transcript_32989/g.83245  ORF Transcript_32989/g.83245 Transcript_32989/m.83245 type:complete len:302 (-) Transcript_32989:196-1101(-)
MRGVAVSACGAAQPSMLRPNTCRITLAPRMTGGGRHRRSPLLIISTATAPAADSSCPLSAEQDRGVQAKIADQATLKRQSLANRVADALADKALLVLAANKMADKLPGVEVPFNPSYTEVVDVTREVVKGRSPREQQQFVSEALLGLFPSYARAVLRTVWPCAQWSAELDTQITQAGFKWLVGHMEIQAAEVEFDGEKQVWNSQVKIVKCKYLETSGCVGMCTNLCKVPTQDFFAEVFDMPMTMEPNFEDLSCTCTFGRRPLSAEKDPCYSQPCFKTCSMPRQEHSQPSSAPYEYRPLHGI